MKNQDLFWNLELDAVILSTLALDFKNDRIGFDEF